MLQNCHLLTSWLKVLDKLLDGLSQQGPQVKGTLRQYGEFSEEVAQLFLQRIAASGTSRWLPNTTVDSIQLHGCVITQRKN